MNRRVCVLQIAFLPYLIPPVRQFLQGLAARGCAVTLIKTYARGGKHKEQPRPEVNNWMLDLLARRLPSHALFKPLVLIEFTLRAVWLGLKTRPNLVAAMELDTLPAAILIAKLCGAKLVYYPIELYAERPGFSPRWFWIGLERRLINVADLTVACEPNRARVMHENYGARELPMTVLNVPPYQAYERTRKIQDWLSEQGVTGEKKIAFYVGELRVSRCTDTFIEAAKQFGPDIVLVLLGPVGVGYDPRATIAACGVADRVFVHGPVSPEEVMAWTCSAHLGLQTQINDGLNHLYCAPIKLFQYLMAGLPVVASNFPGMLDVVEKNDVGLCMDPLSVDAVARAINAILGDETLRARMAENAHRVARDRYNYEIEGAPLFEAVEALLNPTTGA